MSAYAEPSNPRAATSLDMIRSRLDTLTKSERRVADCILSEPNDIVRISITELAERAGVGEATVSRFCRRLGLLGFQDLKISIATDLSPAAVVRESDLRPTDGTDGGLRPAIRIASRRAADMLANTAEALDPESLDNAVHALAHARKIDIYGQGASAITALDAQHGLIRLGMAAHSPLDTHSQAMSASLLRRGDVSIAISHTGSARDVVASQQLALANGAQTICVTGAARSPLVAASTIVLLTASEDTLVSNLRSKMAQLFVLQLLIEGCAREIGQPAQEALQLTTAAVVDKMY